MLGTGDSLTPPSVEMNTGVPFVPTNGALAVRVPVLDILGENDLTTCGANRQGHVFDCSSGAAGAAQEAPFYSPGASGNGCVIPHPGHDISLARNNSLQIDDGVRCEHAYVGTRRGRNTDDGPPRNRG
jgi:hypothetical protein